MKTMQDVLKDAMKNGGGTYYWYKPYHDNWEGWQKHNGGGSGFMVAVTPGIDNLPKLRKIVIDDFVNFHELKERHGTGSYLGLWFDPDEKLWSVDNTYVEPNLGKAIAVGLANDQKAIYDMSNGMVITI